MDYLQDTGAGSPYTFNTAASMNMDVDMDKHMYRADNYIEPQQQSYQPQNGTLMYNYTFPNHAVQQSNTWPATPMSHQQSLHHQHSSTSIYASSTLYPRNSNGSNISHWHPRSSTASTNTTWSQSSNLPNTNDQHISSLGSITDFNFSTPPSYAPSSVEEPASPSTRPTVKKRTTQRSAILEKDPFATCVSRTQRGRRSAKEPRYWCTSCEEPFIEKFDWKRHEETYQERLVVLECDFCDAIYFLAKDFVNHHHKWHRCKLCKHTKDHVQSAKKDRLPRSGWGCGFCIHFSTDWKERCDHIAHHFEKENLDMKSWHHSRVIYSLLKRPVVQKEWAKILQSQPHINTSFSWNKHSTGRVDGYPENGATPKLQDRLEYYRSGDDAAALAQLAFEKIIYPPSPPRVPRKDYSENRHNATIDDVLNDRTAWNNLIGTILEEGFLPTDLNFNYGYDEMSEEAFGLEFNGCQ